MAAPMQAHKRVLSFGACTLLMSQRGSGFGADLSRATIVPSIAPKSAKGTEMCAKTFRLGNETLPKEEKNIAITAATAKNAAQVAIANVSRSHLLN